VKRWTLIPDWKRLWIKLWSVKLALIAGLLSGIEAAVAIWIDGRPAILALGVMAISFGAAVSRIVAQPKLHQ